MFFTGLWSYWVETCTSSSNMKSRHQIKFPTPLVLWSNMPTPGMLRILSNSPLPLLPGRGEGNAGVMARKGSIFEFWIDKHNFIAQNSAPFSRRKICCRKHTMFIMLIYSYHLATNYIATESRPHESLRVTSYCKYSTCDHCNRKLHPRTCAMTSNQFIAHRKHAWSVSTKEFASHKHRNAYGKINKLPQIMWGSVVKPVHMSWQKRPHNTVQCASAQQ